MKKELKELELSQIVGGKIFENETGKWESTLLRGEVFDTKEAAENADREKLAVIERIMKIPNNAWHPVFGIISSIKELFFYPVKKDDKGTN